MLEDPNDDLPVRRLCAVADPDRSDVRYIRARACAYYFGYKELS
jgi:hypothetical protein